MASYVPPGDSGGNARSQEPQPEEPIPGWRKPIALVGWGALIAVLIGLIIWGVTGTPTNNSPSPGAFPHLPSVITVPSLPGLPTEITLPPGL